MDQLFSAFTIENAITQSHFMVSFAFVFVASLVGSLHCVSMCGGLSMSAAHSQSSMWSYHFGRLLGYSIIGAIVGVTGKKFFETLSGYSFYSFLLIAGVLALLIYFLALKVNLKSQVMKLFKFIRIKKLSHNTSALLLGLFTPLIPCGWLYAFVLLAFSSADLLTATGLLLAFWLGTVPILFVFQMGLHKYLPKLKTVPKVILICGVVAFSFYNVQQHFSHARHNHKSSASKGDSMEHHHHHQHNHDESHDH